MERNEQLEVRTDLAVEAKEMYVSEGVSSQQQKESTSGVNVIEKKIQGYTITYVEVNQEGEKKINKKAGHYITLESNAIKKHDTDGQQTTAEVLSQLLAELLIKNEIQADESCLIVGLGNGYVTPDALGPEVIEKILVTKHLFDHHPELVEEGYRPVAAFSPGVMGVTGVETSDIINGLIAQIKPAFIIAIDALASRSIERVNTTIQLSDAGIHPGSGVGNKRKELSKETFGIPVIAIGVPTVVDAVTITSDTIDYVFKHFGRELNEQDKPAKSLIPAGLNFGEKTLTEEDMPHAEKREAIFGMIGQLSDQEKRQLISEVLSPLGHNLMVTPKEIDGLIHDMANVIATGINGALHQHIDSKVANSFTR
ncbi:GPR endopeptidase . Aspartic peptidase. MEROPS family A25 [Amphibacillus marinus]|uniref:Germination protease n=1 Tax=Amphibacillus marinus TaxID=872970 RepID=A0A1H8NSM8_9BACI|nr:GPR endopeptidase . Aspartic peptidase. MEROPS family A25 [Amphibacillus marinus]